MLKARLPYLSLALAILALDQASKKLIELYQIGRPPTEVIPGLLNLTYTTNSGIAFGFFSTGGNPIGVLALTALGLGALAVVGVYFFRTSSNDRLLLASLALILGGAVGNLIDRVASGAVTDFIDFYYGSYHWHTFNVADSAITVGICLMLLDAFLPKDRQKSGDVPPYLLDSTASTDSTDSTDSTGA